MPSHVPSNSAQVVPADGTCVPRSDQQGLDPRAALARRGRARGQDLRGERAALVADGRGPGLGDEVPIEDPSLGRLGAVQASQLHVAVPSQDDVSAPDDLDIGPLICGQALLQGLEDPPGAPVPLTYLGGAATSSGTIGDRCSTARPWGAGRCSGARRPGRLWRQSRW